jgi:hypothetical protein
MDINNIIKVKFLKSDETISGSNIKETDIELDNLLKLISDVEEKRGLGKSLHKEAFTGIDYLGNEIKFNSYVIWTENEIFKYNFSESYIPLNLEILRRKRYLKLFSQTKKDKGELVKNITLLWFYLIAVTWVVSFFLCLCLINY